MRDTKQPRNKSGKIICLHGHTTGRFFQECRLKSGQEDIDENADEAVLDFKNELRAKRGKQLFNTENRGTRNAPIKHQVSNKLVITLASTCHDKKSNTTTHIHDQFTTSIKDSLEFQSASYSARYHILDALTSAFLDQEAGIYPDKLQKQMGFLQYGNVSSARW